ncbi:geranylgeranyl diphosphate synthase, type II [Dethiosulfovibrio salsuginis]|uniref:Geranylgeranyl diphosphate synthase, type II n=1 Tax=Dethiosulfovibrio salsuginis TaxID=561720 RepID=A0A1X7I4A3_9BACT|nr:geranylgeranyl diphosphate synthase, type II [Dethiosulfovibrio salsuginis]
MQNIDVREILKDKKNIFEIGLQIWADNPPANTPETIWNSMVYSMKVGGKRLRPVLCLASAELFGVSNGDVMPMALALEMVHTASLIHDDLPAMDDDDLRRGKPTNHVVYGEAMAILAGDALLCHAFEYPMVHLNLPPERIIAAISCFAKALGPYGMCGGQVWDMEGKESPENISALKTGQLIRASVVTGAILAGATVEDQNKIDLYGSALGTAFQIADDILDVIGTEEQMGKSIGKDQSQGKRTFVSVYGLDGARTLLNKYTDLGISHLSGFGDKASFLIALSKYLEHRTM